MTELKKTKYDGTAVLKDIKHFHNNIKTHSIDRHKCQPIIDFPKSIDWVVEQCTCHDNIEISSGRNEFEQKDFFEVVFTFGKYRVWYDIKPSCKDYFISKYNLMEVY